MLKKIFIPLLALVFSLTACNTEETKTEETVVSELEEFTVVEDPVIEEKAEELFKSEPGEIHLDYPRDISTDSEANEFVLAPSRSFLDAALKGESETFVFYDNLMVEPGEKESKIKELFNETMIPNSLIIRIPKGESVKPGDIVLTWWQSGSGMQRAIIVEGGTELEPMAKYLDLKLENEPEQLAVDSYVKLTEEFQAGTSVAVKDGEEFLHETVINVKGDKVLTKGWAGKLFVREKSMVTPIEIKPELSIGEEVYVPVIANMMLATITKIDEQYGQVTVKYEWGGEETEEEFPYGSIIKELK